MPRADTIPSSVHARRFAVVMLLGYLGVSFGVHHCYPFYIFDMYSSPPPTSSSRLAVRTAAGALREVRDFVSWRCQESPRVEGPRSCGVDTCINARDREVYDYIEQNAGRGVDPVTLVRRVWRFRRPLATGVEEVRVASCVARAR